MKTIFTMLTEFIALLSMFALFYIALLFAPGIEQTIIEWKAGR
jgi:ferric iron reductase protein FhuF